MGDARGPQGASVRNGWLIALGVGALAAVALAAWGDPALLPATLAGVGLTLGATAALVGAYAVTAAGLGIAVWPLVRRSRERAAIGAGVGAALALTLSHGLGVLGWLTTPAAVGLAIVAAAVCFVAWARAKDAERDRAERPARAPGGRLAWLAAVPVAVLAVAAGAPAGWLWASEFGAYDALAYHLQLPQEWWRQGRVWPGEHNVYAFLPGYVEAAFVHLAALGAAPVDGAEGHGLTAGSAWRAQAAHGLSAAFAVLAAVLLGRFVRAVLEEMDADGRAQRLGAWVGGALVLATPWVVVVGSIAYNETAVLALGAGAMLAAVDRRVRPVWRGAIAGGLVGVACGCKPTAMVFVTPVVGLLLLGYAERRAWAPLAGGAVVAGLLALAPWLVRNWMASGNPVFPAMTGVFGAGHWTAEQAARFASAHAFDGSVPERVRLLLAGDPGAPTGAPLVERFRGFANPQWGLLLPMGVVGAALTVGRAGAGRPASLLAGGLAAQLLAWMFLTHLQSRFLLPCVLTLAPLVAIAAVRGRGLSRARFVGEGAVLVQTLFLVGVFVAQHGGRPNAATGVGLSLDLARPASEAVASVRPWAWVNANLPRDGRLYLVGDAAAFFYERDVVVNSTWDAWPIGELMEADPRPESWTRALRDEGVDAVLISMPEVRRLRASGWIDPRVTQERLDAWVWSLGEPTMVWPEAGRALWVIGGEGG